MNPIQRWTLRSGTTLFLQASAALARPQRLASVSSATMGTFGSLVARLRGVTPVDDPESLGRAWQQGFAATKEVPVVGTDGDSAYGEIHTVCPLRGTGDLDACHRMMAYDRAVVAAAGGTFEVVRSQASPGVEFCEVAMHLTPRASGNT